MLASRISRIRFTDMTLSKSRHVTQSIYAVAKPEGVGATVRRSFPILGFRQHDPFLALDDAATGAKGGFPDHPHRGFETVTYLFKGRMQHEDFSGHKGIIGPGDLQWMTAGRGIVHCEMPLAADEESGNSSKDVDESKDGQDDAVVTHGLQLWVNLSKKDKICPPAYQDLKDHVIPRVSPCAGVEVKVIAGESHGIESKIYTRTPTMYLDFKMDKYASVDQTIPKEYAAFVYMVSGKAYFGENNSEDNNSNNGSNVDSNKNRNITINNRIHEPFEGTEHHSLILSQDDATDILHVETQDAPAHFVLLAGLPTGEPSVRNDLFVMNSKEEVEQAVDDYRNAKNGFENAKTWRSSIGPKGYRLKF